MNANALSTLVSAVRSELSDVTQQAANEFDSLRPIRQETLQTRQSKKKNSVFGNDFEEFMALEKIKQQEAELQSWMQLYGRAGLWPDWVRYQAQARKQRQLDIAERERKRAELIEAIGIFAIILISALIVFGTLYFLARKKAWL